ncbi:MAG: peptidase domain-containing ABC transporter [Hyphomicrobiales bacterium]|nr:peptidase domain-containing ABC transporter [Hyphomicrobiales bacterium]MCP5372290.1 peptidase domain-containing ABC transporter [Hyphomicrobiales bacterium]
MDETTSAAPGEQAPFAHTAIQCFVALARKHGADLSVRRLIHDYALNDREPDDTLLLRIMREQGFKARATRMTWKGLAGLGAAFPVLARLKNGNSVLLLGLRAGEAGTEVGVLDPLADRPVPVFLSQERFTKAWDGAVVLVKRVHRLTDAGQPFGLRWFVPEFLRHRAVFLDVTLAALFIHAVGLLTPIFFQIVIDKVLVHKSYSTLNVIALGMGAALVFDALLTFLRSYLLLHATNKIDMRVAARTYGKLLTLPLQFFEQTTAGVLTKHMQQTQKIREFLTGRLFMTMLDSLALLVFVPVLFFYSTKLTLVVLACAGVIAVVILVLIGPYQRRLRALYQAEAERQSHLVETIHGMRTVKALALEPQRRKTWDERVAQAVERHFAVGRISVSARAVVGLVEKSMLVALPWFGASLVFGGEITVGALVAFNMLAGRVSGPLVAIVSLVHEYQETALSVRMLGEVMNRPSEAAGRGRGIQPPLQGAIRFDNVSFSYAPDAKPALRDIDLDIPAGAYVGVVGRSGSGKSTMARLMQGLYPVQQGAVTVDGFDLRELDLVHLRHATGVVLQDNFLFRGTVRENIAVARPDASLERIVQAARMAGADEFVQRLPQGYDTPLEEDGANLSGGQKQRLAIARVLLRNPRILILDEATSALDPESEGIIQDNLALMRSQRTLVVISHRLANLVDADFIVVVDQGRIVGQGPHAHLLQTCDIYGDLWRRQTRHLG